MTESNEDKISRLRSMVATRQRTWDLSVNDVDAIKFALSEIERLTQEKRSLQNEVDVMKGEAIPLDLKRLNAKANRLIDTIRSVADTNLIANYELYQYLHANDTTKEVIE